MQASASSKQLTAKQRYLKLAVLVIVAGNIYPLIYLRQSYEISIIGAFGITSAQLNDNYTWLGIIYVLTYIPSGWLADRVSPRVLMSFSLLAAGLIGAWFSTLPSPEYLPFIFIGWGLAAGLTFWSALIKATTILAEPHEQGRYFGILESGRGLVEALLASIAIFIFSYFLETIGKDTSYALVRVIWLYVGMMLLLAPIAYFVLNDKSDKQTADVPVDAAKSDALLSDISEVLRKPEIWLCAFCILTGYQLFWATYSFSAYMQTQFNLTAITAGSVTAAMLWMRVFGAASAGFIGDYWGREKVLAIVMVLGSAALAVVAILPQNVTIGVLTVAILTIGFLAYAIRGIFWATLDSCDVSNKAKGLAIGLVSFVGYSPDIYLPKLNNYLLAQYPGKEGYLVYYSFLAFMGVLGALAAWKLQRIAASRLAE